jgi:hypothetical protein
MKRKVISLVLLTSLLTGSLLTPARAADPFPQPPQPSWWGQSGLTDVRYGMWAPCNTELGIVNDCVQGINLYKSDNTPAGALTYQPLEGFDFSKAVQYWLITETPYGPIENSAYIKDLQGPSINHWKLPEGITTTDGSNIIEAYVHLMANSLQINTISNNQEKSSLPEGYFFEFKIKSTGMSKSVKWVLSNVRDPQISITGDLITIKGIPENSPSAKLGDNVCETNLFRAKTTQRNIAINLIYKDAGNKTTETRPDDVILGTNGWWCLSDFRFDRESQQIIVKVGNAHFDEFGNEVQGWMELKVKGTRARDWWGINPAIAAGYAKVQITYQDGTSKVATVTSQYDAKNDWINLRAYGFTYSTPQLAISFKQPEEAAKQETKVVSPKKTSITCVKGKTTKKVTAVKPKCPSGYKKK